MALAWFICPYIHAFNSLKGINNQRYCAMDNFTAQIRADSGHWAETEILGDVALVKVRADASTLTTIAGTAGFIRITNHFLLTDSLADLTTAQRNAVQTRLLAMGYTQAEINAAMGTNLTQWRQKTFSTLLQFIATRRRKPRYDPNTDAVILDGPVQPTRSISSVNQEVT